VAVTDDRHQIIVQAQAHGVPQEQELLQPVLTELRESYQDLGLAANILTEAKLSADAGLHSEGNLEWLAGESCDAYVADNLFRKRDPRFVDADKYKPPKPLPQRFSPKDFQYDPEQLTCACPAGQALYRNGRNVVINGRKGIKFTAPKSHCRECPLRARCLRDPHQASPRQVVFFHDRQADLPKTHTAKMKEKIDTPVGRMRYSQRLGTVEPPFGNIRHTKGMNRFTLREPLKILFRARHGRESGTTQ